MLNEQIVLKWLKYSDFNRREQSQLLMAQITTTLDRLNGKSIFEMTMLYLNLAEMKSLQDICQYNTQIVLL